MLWHRSAAPKDQNLFLTLCSLWIGFVYFVVGRYLWTIVFRRFGFIWPYYNTQFWFAHVAHLVIYRLRVGLTAASYLESPTLIFLFNIQLLVSK